VSDDGLELIRTRRVVRAMTGEPVRREQLEQILEAATHAPRAGNRRLQRFVVVDRASTLRVLRMVSPGMLQRPAAAIVICTDVAKAVEHGFVPGSRGLYVDVGTAGQTMLLAAHALRLGSGPVTSFSKAAVGAALNLPQSLRPEMIICLGHPDPNGPPPMTGRRHASWRDLTHWGRFEADRGQARDSARAAQARASLPEQASD
jgi:nitroreductase